MEPKKNSQRNAQEILDTIIETVKYACWSKYTEFSDSPGHQDTHEKMRKHLELVESLHPAFQSYLRTYLSQIRQTLHMSTRNYEAALQEIMKNDPEGRKIVEGLLESLAETFQSLGFGVLPGDFLPKPE